MSNATSSAAPSVHISVQGMTCGHCEASVRGALAQLPDATNIVVDREAAQASLNTTASVEDAVAAVNAIGFDAAAS